jgi:hypothetical protein
MNKVLETLALAAFQMQFDSLIISRQKVNSFNCYQDVFGPVDHSNFCRSLA